jgi:murein DD-endopeptidase MepM/ murein hydrolase activator NlpD
LALTVLISPAAQSKASQVPLMFPTPKRLNIFTREENGVTHFYLQNLGIAPITATCDLNMTNMTSDKSFPYTTTLSSNETVDAFTIAIVDTNAPWDFSLAHSCVIGSTTAVPDDSFVYRLPYETGKSYRVSQGYHGKFSHTGPDDYAIDWKMPVGTPVLAAREGLVVQSKDDMDCGGSDPKFEKCANTVMIQHADGTIGIYAHLKCGGNKVSVGDYVKAGDEIALSGNTGFTSGPHLHFSVFMAKNGKERLSLPVKFHDVENASVTLVMGHSYTAAPVEPVLAETVSLIANQSSKLLTDSLKSVQ